MDKLERAQQGFKQHNGTLTDRGMQLRELMVAAPEGYMGGAEQNERQRLAATKAVCEYLQKALGGYDGTKRRRKQFCS